MGLLKDIWRVGIIPAEREAVIADGVSAFEPVWLPSQGTARFLADPFGMWRDGRLQVFVEAYDYRDRHGVIDAFEYDADLNFVARRPVLREAWHLSYPFLIEADGELWMLPEAFRSGGLTLYRCVDFPGRWEPAGRLELDAVPIDPSPVFHHGLWWMFYTPAGSTADKISALHIAWAERLQGPWRAHAGNPVLYDAGEARPGGAPFVRDGRLVLPVQDCRRTYGGAIRLLEIEALTPDRFAARIVQDITSPPAFAPHVDGLHTLNAAGTVTLFDVKRQVAGPRTLAIDAHRAVRRWLGRPSL